MYLNHISLANKELINSKNFICVSVDLRQPKVIDSCLKLSIVVAGIQIELLSSSVNLNVLLISLIIRLLDVSKIQTANIMRFIQYTIVKACRIV